MLKLHAIELFVKNGILDNKIQEPFNTVLSECYYLTGLPGISVKSSSSGIAMEGVDVLNVVTSVYELNVSDTFQSVQK